MSPRAAAIVLALFGIALTIAQLAFPAREWYHSWQAVASLAIAFAVPASYAIGASRGRDGVAGRRLALALAGALVVSGAGLLCALIGPDTVTVVGAPGTVVPVPDLGAAAFFGAGEPATIAAGTAQIVLRRRGAPPVVVTQHPLPLDLAVVFAAPHPAAFVAVRDLHGNRLTLTQPANPAFLSPVLLFRETQAIRDRTYPLDTFAVPARKRIVHVLYVSAAELSALRHGEAGGAGGAILSVADDAGNSRGLTIAPAGQEIAIDGMRITVTLGRYPQLVVAAAPQPLAAGLGTLLFLAAGAWAALTMLPGRAAVTSQAS